MKRLSMTCILIALLTLVFSCAALAEDGGEWVFDTYNYALEGYNGPGGDVVIPDMIDGCTVDIIHRNFLNSTGNITSLVLPETVRQIEYGSIAYCEDLVSLELNDGLLIIEDNCFTGNPLLAEVTIPASVSYIGNACFVGNTGMEKVTFLGECPVFDGVSFDWPLENLTIYVPDDQYDAYYAAFEKMGVYPDLQKSGVNAEIIDFTSDPIQFGIEEDGTIYCFEGYDVRVDVPSEVDGIAVKAIGEEALAEHRYMCYLTLPEGVEVIGDRAFEDCTNLLYIDFPSTLKTIGERAFAGGIRVQSLNLPESLESIGTEAFDYAARLTGALDLPDGLVSVEDRAFANCVWLEEVYIPESVTNIGEEAFDSCGVSYVVFEGAILPEIADSAFANCTYLSDIDLHTTATKQQMLDLQAVVDELGLECRVWRAQNPDVNYIEDGLDTYENGVMTAYTGEQSHVRPWDMYDDFDVTAIGEGVFRDSKTIEYFAVPYNDRFTEIGVEAFAGSALRKVDLFDSVTTIADGAFRDCASLAAPKLPDSLTSIGSDAFKNCSSIDSLVLPDTLETIGSGAFSGCTGVEELVLPASLQSVGSGALNGCTGLKKLVVMCDATLLPADLLEGCSADMEIYAAETATDDQLKHLSALAGRAWNFPVTRIGEPLPEIVAMPYEPLPGADFWYDEEFARLDNYNGYERNLILPREIDGVPMLMIGGSAMFRAAYVDDYEVELPVVSVVIPETYEEIVPYAFANCNTLETVICYAPIELLPDCAFQNCTNLREVIFVNGVREIGENVFDNCPNLETVYLGKYVEAMSEYAFMNIDGTPGFPADAIADPAVMPDIEALLEAVKCEPMPTPEPTATPEPAVPVGEAGKAFFGVWHGTEMDMGGEMVALSEYEMAMTLLLCEDGRALMSDSETIDPSLATEEDWYSWRVENGTAYCDQFAMMIGEDGRLCLNEDGLLVYFEKGEDIGEIPPAPAAPTAAPADPAPIKPAPANPAAGVQTGKTGVKYVCLNADIDGYTVDASMLGGEYSLVFHEGGTVDFVVVGSAMPTLNWVELEDGSFQIDYYGTMMDVVWTDTGFDMDYFDTMLMHFVPEN